MTHIPPYSGKYGYVNNQHAVRNWQASRTTSPQKYVNSQTLGGPGRLPGIKDWSGSFGCYGATPLVMPGQLFTFTGFTSPDSAPPTGVGDAWAGPAIVDSMQIDWNWESGAILAHQISFSSVGAGLVVNGSANYVDSGVATLQTTIGLQAVNATSNSPVTIANVTQGSLQISAENQAYVNSSTFPYTGRRPGNIDATMSLTIQDSNPTQMAADITDDLIVQLQVTGGESPTYWLLQWMHYKDFSNLNVDRESGAIISFQANFELNLVSGGDIGCIMLPSAESAYLGVTP